MGEKECGGPRGAGSRGRSDMHVYVERVRLLGFFSLISLIEFN